MSAPSGSGAARGISNGPPSAQLPPQQAQGPPPSTAGANPSQQNLNQIVLEYLSKKGYNRTEAMLRRESAHQDAEGRPIISSIEESGGDSRDAQAFFNLYKNLFTRDHVEDIRGLEGVSLPEHVSDNRIAQLYRNNRYRLTLTKMAFTNLIQFLESKDGGSIILGIIQNHLDIKSVDRAAAGNERGLAALLARGGAEDDMPAEDEGIPGHNPGSANTDRNAPPVLARLNLGPLPMEPELMEDVRAALQEDDAKKPPAPGQESLEQVFDRQIKREPVEDAPSRDAIPLPPSLARDVAMEVQKVRENRDRFRIDGRTGGVGPGISVTMFTFHNTYDSINCLDFSGDNLLVAAGMSESYIRVWSLEGKALPSILPRTQRTASILLPPSHRPLRPHPSGNGPPTSSQYLLSCSADKTIRLWSLDTWTCLVAYKSHDSPVWDVQWGPYGHYFLSGSHDRTARLWSTDHIEPLRIFAGHDQDVDVVAWHPNGAYVFTGSSDRQVRMWDVGRGNAVRMFTSHTGNITALACAPDGQTLASADDVGTILLWDLKNGTRKKRMRGHGKGGIWSLTWSVESTVLVSGGADGTVRVWDVLLTTAESNGKVVAEGARARRLTVERWGAGREEGEEGSGRYG
ncbi:Transcription initiation factor TFIID subunit 5 [Coniosporium tulheliwenetii]|uniref:Transcription initiation factor TFIID subunit 5 n=1 Tax=Coniosporium tulheliwenetii TaxID=3383036 RepID=A0ACC2ZID7_9PEZI|nr:Transcription initiation factor TFIID subunit 5 [Cladosporium sp. JES 115]